MEIHIPKGSAVSIKRGDCFDLIFDEDGEINHDNKTHLDPPLTKHSVKAHEKSHHCAKQKGKVELQFTPNNSALATTRTILIGD
jgi:hypothetical protein